MPRQKKKFHTETYSSYGNTVYHSSQRQFFTPLGSEIHKLPKAIKTRENELRRRKHFHDVREPKFHNPADEAGWDTRAGITVANISARMACYHRYLDYQGELVGVGRIIDGREPVDFVTVKEGDEVSYQQSPPPSPTRRALSATLPNNFLRKNTKAVPSPMLAKTQGLPSDMKFPIRGSPEKSTPHHGSTYYSHAVATLPLPVTREAQRTRDRARRVHLAATLKPRELKQVKKILSREAAWDPRFHIRPSRDDEKQRLIKAYLRNP